MPKKRKAKKKPKQRKRVVRKRNDGWDYGRSPKPLRPLDPKIGLG